MEEMSKKTKRLEKENHTLNRKHEQTNRNILEMAEERTRNHEELERWRKKCHHLEALCRRMQAQGRGEALPEGDLDGDDEGTESEYDEEYEDDEDEEEMSDEDELDAHAHHIPAGRVDQPRSGRSLDPHHRPICWRPGRMAMQPWSMVAIDVGCVCANSWPSIHFDVYGITESTPFLWLCIWGISGFWLFSKIEMLLPIRSIARPNGIVRVILLFYEFLYKYMSCHP